MKWPWQRGPFTSNSAGTQGGDLMSLTYKELFVADKEDILEVTNDTIYYLLAGLHAHAPKQFDFHPDLDWDVAVATSFLTQLREHFKDAVVQEAIMNVFPPPDEPPDHR
jgi:hypothetical protein